MSEEVNNIRGMRIRVERSDYMNRALFFAWSWHDDRNVRLLKPIEFEIVSSLEPSRPFMELENAEAQGLMDAMWQAGFRPKHEIEESSQIAAVRYHLEDMRALVFRKQGQERE